MTRPADELDHSVAAPAATRLDRLLDCMNARITSIGRTIWRAVVEGFAACGMAECGYSLHDPDRGQEPERATALPISGGHEVSDNAHLASDFADLDALMRYVRAMGE
jgi:hypothetical protein